MVQTKAKNHLSYIVWKWIQRILIIIFWILLVVKIYPIRKVQFGEMEMSLKGKNGDNYLAMNIVNFEIDFHVEDDGNRSTPTLYFERSKKNPNRSVIYGGKSATVGPQAKLEHYQRALAYADIKLTVLSDTGAEMLRNIDQRPETPEDVIRLHGEEFIRRVHFPVKPF